MAKKVKPLAGEEGVFTVESIMGKRLNKKGELEYLIKWEDFDDRFNTWETHDNISDDLIQTYELEQDQGEIYIAERILAKGFDEDGMKVYLVKWKGYPREEDHTWELEANLSDQRNLVEDFENRQPEEILGVRNDRELGLMFLVKYKGQDATALMPAKEAHIKCPQLLIQYYQNRIVWD